LSFAFGIYFAQLVANFCHHLKYKLKLANAITVNYTAETLAKQAPQPKKNCSKGKQIVAKLK